MSIEGMCSRHRVEIRREVATATGKGASSKTWTTVARGALPALDVKCCRQALKPQEAIAYGVASGLKAWRHFFYFDPSIDKRDHLVFSDGGIKECEVLLSSWQRDSQDRLWECVVVEFGPAKR